MEKLIEKIENLKKELDETPSVKKIKDLNQQIKEDAELQIMLKEYHRKGTSELKEQICNHGLYQEYKEQETEINLIILEMNQKLKTVKNKGQCGR